MATDETIIWSGKKYNQHREGAALVIGKEEHKTLLEWKPLSEILLYSRFNSKFAKMSIITANASMEDAEEEVKDDFCDNLQSAVEAIPRHNVLLVIGDLNARVGKNNTGREIVVKHRMKSGYPSLHRRRLRTESR